MADRYNLAGKETLNSIFRRASMNQNSLRCLAIGPETLFEDNGVIPKAEPALKETLGKLTTEEFYRLIPMHRKI